MFFFLTALWCRSAYCSVLSTVQGLAEASQLGLPEVELLCVSAALDHLAVHPVRTEVHRNSPQLTAGSEQKEVVWSGGSDKVKTR